MSKASIVIVEDNPGDVELLRIALDRQAESYQLVVLADGAEALRFLRQLDSGGEPEPCVILLDIHLPKYNGLEVLEAIRREASLAHVQVAVLTSGGLRPQEAETIQRLGASFRPKPRDFSDVLRLAADVIEMCKRAMTAA